MIVENYFFQVDDFKMLDEKQSVNSKRPKKCITNIKEISAKESTVSEASLGSANADICLATSFSDNSVAHLPGGQSNNKVVSGIVGSDLMLSTINAMKNRFDRLHLREATYIWSF